MKRYSLWVKFLAFSLAVVTLVCVAVSALGILMAESLCMYTQDDYEEWLVGRYRDIADQVAVQVLMDYGAELSDCPEWVLEQTDYVDSIKKIENWFALTSSNWCYTIMKNGKLLRSTYTADFKDNTLQYAFEKDSRYPVTGVAEEYTEYYRPSVVDQSVPVHYEKLTGYQVNVWISRNYTSTYMTNGLSPTMMEWLFTAKFAIVGIAVVSFILFAGAFVFLLIVAGKSPKTGEVSPKALNRLPLDLYLAVAAGITVAGTWLASEMLDILFSSDGYNVIMVMLMCGCGVAVATADIGFCVAFAAQCKMPGLYWWKHSVSGCLLGFGWKIFQKCWGYFAKGLRRITGYIRDVLIMLPVIWKWIAAGGVLGVILVIICEANSSYWYSWFPLAIWCLVFALAVIYCGYSYGIIQKGIKRMKSGNLDEKIHTEWLFGSFKMIAQDLNALADVVAMAAEKQLKSERMKTELITNVSHDIKTPLTSVINYVDLLQQPHTEEEGTQYLEVLSRQSARLKKLVEDLMDMSKASTGNVAVNIATMDAVEAVNQALGEFSDKLAQSGLTPVFRTPDHQLHMLADGRLTWRVLSNLLSNVVKYALPGTRVYLDLLRLDRAVVLSVKNISREALNISAEELTERFVRGDASRNTEGSGLGLNIAQSLMALQHGSLNITVDGDLFKVTLTFPVE